MKARAWLARGRGREPIDALTDFWRGFNNLFAGEKGQERSKIRSLLEGKLTGESAQALLERHGREMEYLLSQPIIDMRGNGRDTSPQIKIFHASKDPVERVVQLFLIIYQVRCNLEHGQKSPDRERDLRLCASAAPLVADAIELCA
jgi:hypothetical protein